MRVLAGLVVAMIAIGLGLALSSRRESSPASSASAKTSSHAAASSSAVASSGAQPSGAEEREVVLELDNEGLEGQIAAIEAALAPSASSVASLTLRAYTSFGDAGLARVIERHPDLAPSTLRLISTGLTPQGVSTLLGSRAVSRLEVLDLQDNLLGAAGAQELAASKRLGTLVELNLARNHLHEAGAVALAAARGLSNLKRLELAYNFIGSRGAKALARSTALPRLEELGLAYNFVKDEGALEISRERWPGLTLLDLRSNEIEEAGASALVESKTLPPSLALCLASNFLDEKDAGAPDRVHLDGIPPNESLSDSGLSGNEGFDPSRRKPLTVSSSAPAGLPSTVEFRELWIWEFGFVADFPIFMMPERAPGNGKGRSFTWLDRARLSIGGYWPLEQNLDAIIAEEIASEPGGRATVERKRSKLAIIRRSAGKTESALRRELAHGALLYVDFSYDDEYAAYFAPIVERVMSSAYFDRKHLE